MNDEETPPQRPAEGAPEDRSAELAPDELARLAPRVADEAATEPECPRGRGFFRRLFRGTKWPGSSSPFKGL
jgi:hypothetical protein